MFNMNCTVFQATPAAREHVSRDPETKIVNARRPCDAMRIEVFQRDLYH